MNASEKLVSAQTQEESARRAWDSPQITRMVAGLAEIGGSNVPDGQGGGQS